MITIFEKLLVCRFLKLEVFQVLPKSEIKIFDDISSLNIKCSSYAGNSLNVNDMVRVSMKNIFLYQL